MLFNQSEDATSQIQDLQTWRRHVHLELDYNANRLEFNVEAYLTTGPDVLNAASDDDSCLIVKTDSTELNENW